MASTTTTRKGFTRTIMDASATIIDKSSARISDFSDILEDFAVTGKVYSGNLRKETLAEQPAEEARIVTQGKLALLEAYKEAEEAEAKFLELKKVHPKTNKLFKNMDEYFNYMKSLK